MIAHAIEIAAAGRAGDDRAAVIPIRDGIVVALADGAGGTANGALAAQVVIDRAATFASWTELEDAVAATGGQTTAIVLAVTATSINGWSVGDSEAWIVRPDRSIVDLSAGQQRKPLVGSGGRPVAIAPRAFDGTLVVASDGLVRYAKRAEIAHLALGDDLGAAARALIARVRLANGELQDDVAIVLVRQVLAMP